jgi:hypothetical protein
LLVLGLANEPAYCHEHGDGYDHGQGQHYKQQNSPLLTAHIARRVSEPIHAAMPQAEEAAAVLATAERDFAAAKASSLRHGLKSIA